MKRYRISVLIGLACVLSVTNNCSFSDIFKYTTYNSYSHITALTYVAPDGHGSAPPSVIMYASANNGSWDTQANIYTWIGGSGSQNSMYAAYNYLSGPSFADTYFHQYNSYDTCNGGRDCKRQGMSDIWNAVLADKVVLVQLGSHAGIVRAVGATRSCHDAGWFEWGCQPSMDFYNLALPVTGGGPTYYITLADFYYYWDGSTVFPSSVSVSAVSNDDWDEYDNLATTYYGDPSPPDTNPDFNTDEEPPTEDYPYPYLPAPLRNLLGLQPNKTKYPALSDGLPSSQERWAQVHQVPYVGPQTTDKVIADCLAGLRRLRLSRQAGLESLLLNDGRLSVSSVASVRAMGDFSDYFIVNFSDHRTGRLYAQATVHANGLIGAVRLVPEPEQHTTQMTPAEAADRMAAADIGLARRPELVYAVGDVTTTPFRPMFEAEAKSGDRFLVLADGRVFAENAIGQATHTLRTPSGPLNLAEVGQTRTPQAPRR